MNHRIRQVKKMRKKNGKPGMAKKGTFKRVIKTLFEFYPVMMPVVLICIVFSAVVSAIPGLFLHFLRLQVRDVFAAGPGFGEIGLDPSCIFRKASKVFFER